jgi:hypothetical protein
VPVAAARPGPATPAAATGGPRASAEGWGLAEELPGSGSLNIGGIATIYSVSCAAPGSCGIGGFYGRDHSDQNLVTAMVASERNGRWSKATDIPDRSSLGLDNNISLVEQFSCSTVGNCGAGGYYITPDLVAQFVATERNGQWGSATQVPGVMGNGGESSAMTCPSVGNCVTGGDDVYPTLGDNEPVVASQRDGTWQDTIAVPGLTAINPTPKGTVSSIDCSSAGNCVAGGFYDTTTGDVSAPFLVTERAGTWRNAFVVPGMAMLNKGRASVYSVSCPSAGNCAAAGYYTPCCGVQAAFVVSQHHGIWGEPVSVERGGAAETISCPSAGNCTAGGYFTGARRRVEAFVITERNGIWGTATEDPGIATLNAGGRAEVVSISCTSPGNCGVGGSYAGLNGGTQAFVQTFRNGTWGKAIEAPGSAKLNRGSDAAINSVSCAGNLRCTAGGFYADGKGNFEAFVISKAS